ncbi:unnamed protein product [Triticum turgidum subsp. durum]|uniref:Uncharacterized protein n=1 Tax=Triticum turgidum subsp. durum TaxID=4567 RepID=A0A9R0Z3I4_TRITD|nr:unnamed protein product [Triticum turgidum subsp. durum]
MRWSPSPAETFSPSHSTAPQCHLSRLTHRRILPIERNARVRDDGDAQTATIFLLFSTATKRSFYDKELIGEQQLHRVTWYKTNILFPKRNISCNFIRWKSIQNKERIGIYIHMGC